MISANHPALTMAPILREIAKPIMQKLNCHYFQYLKVFDDGRFSLLTTQPKWCEFALNYMSAHEKPAVYSHINAELLDKKTYYFLWEPNIPQEPLRLAREFDIANGLSFVERYADHYNMIGFATPVANTCALDTYFNSLNEIKNFIDHFQSNHADLIKIIDNNKLQTPKAQMDTNLERMLYTQKLQYPVNFFDKSGYITAQEYECLKGLSQGMTYKEIANKLLISHRTVESYLNRVRKRFDLSFKRQLIQLIDSVDV